MLKLNNRAGMTLVEVLLAVVLVGVAATLIYNGGYYSYKIMMRSRVRLEAQGVAFDKLWSLFNMPFADLPSVAVIGSEAPPSGGSFPSNGLVRFAVLPETNAPVSWIEYWQITVQVWAPSNSVLFTVMNTNGTVRAPYPVPLAEYTMLRYRGER